MVGSKAITKKGFAKLEARLLDLKENERPLIIKAIAEARAHGDLSENAEYHAAKEKQGFIESHIRDLENKIAHANVIDVLSLSGDIIKFGATVTLYDENNSNEVIYQLVGEYEAEIENMLLSIAAPLGRSLINKKLGDQIKVPTPKGLKMYKVLGIVFK